MSSAAAQAKFEYPIETPETVETQKKALHNIGRLLLDSHADVNDSVLTASDSWRSDTAYTALGDTQKLSTAMKGDSDAVEAAIGPMTTYVGRIEHARDRIDVLRDRYDQAGEDRTTELQHPPDWADNTYLRGEFRDGVQAAYQATIDQLEAEYEDVKADLRSDAAPAVTALREAIEVLAPDAPTSMSLDQVAYQAAAANLSLTGDTPYEYALREAGLLTGPTPTGYYADWLENAEANGVSVQTILEIAQTHGITPEDFSILDGMEEVTDADGKTFFILPDGTSGDDAELAVLMTYILNAGTGYGDGTEHDFDPEPYDSYEVQRIIDRQHANDWSYDDDVAFVQDNGGRLATTPNGMLMGLGGNWLQDLYSQNGGTTYGDIFMLNVDDVDDEGAVLADAIRSGQATYQDDDGNVYQGNLDLDRLLHHEERHSQQWAREGYVGFLSSYVWEQVFGDDETEKDAGLSDGGY
ncbi:hypothetical protein [Nocardioides sp.]|uniref:hypothetical protein n=1 Tax=Nocardioides sp. TaxID=35761 RepID=UPI00271EDB05|nr:hypothetical protein [Nocardioides sp.]MDO9454498.1 hypothetical protein [Nocardioides sp.]